MKYKGKLTRLYSRLRGIKSYSLTNETNDALRAAPDKFGDLRSARLRVVFEQADHQIVGSGFYSLISLSHRVVLADRVWYDRNDGDGETPFHKSIPLIEYDGEISEAIAEVFHVVCGMSRTATWWGWDAFFDYMADNPEVVS